MKCSLDPSWYIEYYKNKRERYKCGIYDRGEYHKWIKAHDELRDGCKEMKRVFSNRVGYIEWFDKVCGERELNDEYEVDRVGYIGPHELIIDNECIEYIEGYVNVVDVKRELSDVKVIDFNGLKLYRSGWKYIGDGMWIRKEVLNEMYNECGD